MLNSLFLILNLSPTALADKGKEKDPLAALRVRDIIARTKEGVGSPKLGPGKGYVPPLQEALARALTSPSKQLLQGLAALIKFYLYLQFQVLERREVVVSSLAKPVTLFSIYLFIIFPLK